MFIYTTSEQKNKCCAPPCRFPKGYRAALGARARLLFNGNGKRENGPGRKYTPLLSGAAYCLSSCSMILLNKIVLSTYAFNAGISLMFYQVSFRWNFLLYFSESKGVLSIMFIVTYHNSVAIYTVWLLFSCFS